MTLDDLKVYASITTLMSLVGLGFETLAFGGDADALLLLTAVIGSLALQVLLLAVVADATVVTLDKKKNPKKEK